MSIDVTRVESGEALRRVRIYRDWWCSGFIWGSKHKMAVVACCRSRGDEEAIPPYLDRS